MSITTGAMHCEEGGMRLHIVVRCPKKHIVLSVPHIHAEAIDRVIPKGCYCGYCALTISAEEVEDESTYETTQAE